MTINEVLKYNSVIKNIIDNTKDVNALVKFRLLGMLRQFQPIVESFETIRNDKVIEYANTIEGDEVTGIIEPKKEDFENDEDYQAAYDKFKECMQKFAEDIDTLVNSDADITIKKFKYTDIIDAGLPADYLVAIYDLIEEWLGGMNNGNNSRYVCKNI